jgi:hypothetical protein
MAKRILANYRMYSYRHAPKHRQGLWRALQRQLRLEILTVRLHSRYYYDAGEARLDVVRGMFLPNRSSACVVRSF